MQQLEERKIGIDNNISKMSQEVEGFNRKLELEEQTAQPQIESLCE